MLAGLAPEKFSYKLSIIQNFNNVRHLFRTLYLNICIFNFNILRHNVMGDVIEWILVVGGFFAVFGLLIFLVTGGLAKLFNSSIYYRGGKMADPNSLEDAYRTIKDKSIDIAQTIKDKSVDLGGMIREKKNLYIILENEKTTKIEKIEKLVELKDNGHINNEEFIFLKSEILKL